MEEAGPHRIAIPERGDSATPVCDQLLSMFLQAQTEGEAESLLHEIIAQHLSPIARRIINHKLRFASHRASSANDHDQVEDVLHDVVVHLLTQLRSFRERPRERAVEDVGAYTAVISYRACYNYLRRKHPQRHGLKNKLRYLLTRGYGLALWESGDSDAVAGYSAWRGSKAVARAQERLAGLSQQAHLFLPPRTLTADCARTRPADLLAAIFDYVGGAVDLDSLVNVVAMIWGVREQHEVADANVLAELPDRSAEISERVEHRELLGTLWKEIRELPVRQRSALLLNMRDADGLGCIALFPLVGVATMRQIADMLELTAEQLAVIWKHMPLDDVTIGERLSISRQQVINLRKSARARLARRLGHLL